MEKTGTLERAKNTAKARLDKSVVNGEAEGTGSGFRRDFLSDSIHDPHQFVQQPFCQHHYRPRRRPFVSLLCGMERRRPCLLQR